MSYCKSSFNVNPSVNIQTKTEFVIETAISKVFSDVLGHYFRNIHRIFVFIDQSEIENKQFYAKIFRAQFSDSELFLLFYNCYFHSLGKNLRTYAEQYDLFDNLPTYKLLHDSHKELLKTS